MALIQRTARRSRTRSPSVRVLYLSQSLPLPLSHTPPDRTLPVAPSFILHPRLAAKFVLRFVSFGFSFFRLFLASLSSNDIPCFFFVRPSHRRRRLLFSAFLSSSSYAGPGLTSMLLLSFAFRFYYYALAHIPVKKYK